MVNTKLISKWVVLITFITGIFPALAQPSFTVGVDINLDESSSSIVASIADWATNINDGGSGQPLSFVVTETNRTGNLDFESAASVAANGSLNFQVAAYTNGTATFDLFLTDGSSNSPVSSFNIIINQVNFPPNGISLSSGIIDEFSPIGTYIGTFSISDPDPEDQLTLEFVGGQGSDDNSDFTIQGSDLLSAQVFDFDIQPVHNIRVRASDGIIGFEQTFQIAINRLSSPLEFANAFTPNGDGENDTWEIDNLDGYPEADIKVYDSSGIKVFEAKGNQYQPWQGTFNGKTLPTGTYYYVINLNNSGQNKLQGTLTILL